MKFMATAYADAFEKLSSHLNSLFLPYGNSFFKKSLPICKAVATFFFFFFNRWHPCGPGWPGTHCVDQASASRVLSTKPSWKFQL